MAMFHQSSSSSRLTLSEALAYQQTVPGKLPWRSCCAIMPMTTTHEYRLDAGKRR